MDKKRTKKKIVLTGDLYREAMLLLEQAEILKDTVTWQEKKVDEIANRYTEEELEKLEWEDKERHLKECLEIESRLNQSVKELQRLTETYDKLTIKVKNYYGKDVMPPVRGFTLPNLGDDPMELL